MSTRTRTRRRLLLAAAALVVVASACSSSDGGAADRTTTTEASQGGPATTAPLGSAPSPIPDGIRIEVLSSQPDRITGDDARIRVSPAKGGSAEDLQVTLDDADVTAQLPVVGGHREGVVRRLVEGTNTMVARAGGKKALLRLRAWPITGPVVSGPHLPLLACSTEAYGLGKPTDGDCSAPTKVDWRYVTTGGKVAPLPSPTTKPADLATATIDGREVPLYVRHEVGVINRSVYELATVSDPASTDPAGPGWNGKLLYRYGGGCGTTFGQGRSMTSVLDPAFLRRGYAVATATFNTFQVQCNDVLSAETTMMVKERAIEELGPVAYTIGEGASGGSIQLHLLTQNYPGLVNGVVASQPFPDALSIAPGVTDCGLLLAYYGTSRGKGLTEEQRAAIDGHATTRTCENWKASFLGAIDPTEGCDPAADPKAIYDPKANRTGVRCTLQDANRNQVGTDPTTGFAQRPLDNVGVQYGLQALNDGTITVAQFLDLNEHVGGYDIDGNIVAAREQADPDTVANAYETGRISMGAGDQRLVPIIDINPYSDPSGDIHDRFRAFSLRDRLTRGGPPEEAPGFQIWTRPAGTPDVERAVDVMDEWLAALRDRAGSGPLASLLEQTRPTAADDNCTVGSSTTPIRGRDLYERPGPCRDRYPLAGDPRTAAGEPRSNFIIKCALKPVDPADYDVDISADELDRLQEIFPQGVCDWSSPGEGTTVPAQTDRSYEDADSPGREA
ncbi:MAG: DUF6351 family protein [Acidimicrobiales bacterium]